MSKGSLRHVRCFVNHPELRSHLNALVFTGSSSLASCACGQLTWTSPLQEHDYKEYRDGEFLRACGLEAEHCLRLQEFWPARGPRWDALAHVPLKEEKRGILLVEAKAYLGELKGQDASRAKGDRLKQIMKSLDKARNFFGVHQSVAPWHRIYYQVCNRLAHLYFMNEVLKIPTWLAWLFIINAPEWPDRAESWRWEQCFSESMKAIGMEAPHPLKDRILVLYAPAAPE